MFLLRKRVKPRSVQHPLGMAAPPPLKPEEMQALTAKLRDRTITESEKERLCTAHIRLAIYIAGQYGHQAPNKIDDLVSEALTAIAVAMTEAPEKMIDNNFTGFCSGRIHSLVNAFVDKDHLVAVPSRTYRHKKAKGEEVPNPVRVVSLSGSASQKSANLERIIATTSERDEGVMKMRCRIHHRCALQARVNRVREIREMIEDAIKSESERLVIELLEQSYTIREIEEKTGMSKSQVSILRTRVAARFEQLEAEH